MCDFFWQRMEAEQQGDLEDIVRAGGRTLTPSAEFPLADCGSMTSFGTSSSSTNPDRPTNNFGDPFTNHEDPLLNESTGTDFFDVQDGPTAVEAGGLLGQNVDLMSEEIEKQPCNIFSRMLQISPAGPKVWGSSPTVIEPSPLPAGGMVKLGDGLVGCTADSMVGIQINSPRSSGIKRRKSQAKKVVCIPAPAAANGRPSGEVVPSDLWAWRKYGQKPIKGSPYPRGYYRCSSSKGCSARKQVERSRTDPNMLVITYTSEHNHPWPTQRNALAGSTRSQPTKNSYSGSKSPPQSQKQLLTLKEAKDATSSSNINSLVKEEVVEMEKPIDAAEDNEFDTAFHERYNPMMVESSHSDDFFADLAELEPDPMNLIFSKEFPVAKPDEERGFNMFDWAGN